MYVSLATENISQVPNLVATKNNTKVSNFTAESNTEV